jgi:hypothetical protein
MFVLVFVPETKGKELESIAQLFVKAQPTRDTEAIHHKNAQGHDNLTFTTTEDISTHGGEKTKM